MSNNNVLGTALSIIDKHILLNHKEIARKIYAETNYCDQDYNKFIAVITSGDLTLRASTFASADCFLPQVSLLIAWIEPLRTFPWNSDILIRLLLQEPSKENSEKLLQKSEKTRKLSPMYVSS